MRNYRIIWSLMYGRVDAPLREREAEICAAFDTALDESLQRERDPVLNSREFNQIEIARERYARNRRGA